MNKLTVHVRSHTAPAPGYNPYPEIRYFVAEVRNERSETVYETPGYQDRADAVAEAKDFLADARSRYE